MKRPAIFFDRDNTLILGTEYLGDPEGVVLNHGAADAVAAARAMGFATVVFSNQSGVAKGLFTEDDVRAVNGRMDAMLRTENARAVIDRHEFCAHHPDASVEAYREDHYRRKPKPGMIIDAAEKMALDLSKSWVIGDAPRDVEAGMAVGCRSILIRDPKIAASPAASVELRGQPDRIVSSLHEAMDYVAHAIGFRSDPAIDAWDAGRQDKAPAPSMSIFAMHEVGNDPPRHAEVRPAEILPGGSPSGPPDAPEPGGTAHASSMPAITASLVKLEHLGDQLLHELRRSHEQHPADFSVSKLLAGIVQIIALAVMFLAYLQRNDPSMGATLLVAIFLQLLTIALLIMSRQR